MEGNQKRYGFSLTIMNWQKIEKGEKPDHFDVETVLTELNNVT